MAQKANIQNQIQIFITKGKLTIKLFANITSIRREITKTIVMLLEYQPEKQELNSFEQFLDDLIDSLDQNFKPQHYVPQQRQQIRLKDNLIANSYIIYGSSGSGKTSSIYWAAKDQPNVKIVLINCEVDTTQQQFINTLTDGIKKHTKSPDKKRNPLIFENMKFDQFNEEIKQSDQKFVIVIKKCEKIAEMKKPTLFYNLLEWVNGPMKKHLGLVFLSRAFHFTDRLQKRVKSRLTAKSITLIRPQGQKIIKIYLKRFEILKDKYQSQIKSKRSSHRQSNPYIKNKLEWLNKIMSSIQNSKGFKQLVHEKINAINNQFISCMKLALLKSLRLNHLNDLKQGQFDRFMVEMMRDASLHISPSYVDNLIKQCPFYNVLVLAIIAYMGIHNRTPYTPMTVFQVYKQFMHNNQRFNGISSLGLSRTLLSKSLDKLFDLRVVVLVGDEDQHRRFHDDLSTSNREMLLVVPPEDIRDIINEMDNIPEVVKEILKG